MNENGDCASMTCPRCKGEGRIKLSDPYLKCVRAIRALGKPTMLEIHAVNGKGTRPTATNKRVMRLEKAGVVKILEGRPMRVELV